MTVSAPGKVFVIGEYAVTRGAPAVVATVGKRLRCRVSARPGRGRVLLRGGGRSATIALDDRGVESVPQDLRFLAAATLVAGRVFDLGRLDLDLTTTSDLDGDRGKTGLGGSAAVTAAAVGALCRLSGGDLRSVGGVGLCTVTAALAHRLAQGGGSGADVVACTVGGLVWVTGLDSRDRPADAAECATRAAGGWPVRFSRLALPPGLALEVVATGRPARTGPRVARFDALCVGGARAGAAAGSTVAAWIRGMGAASEIFRDACVASDRHRLFAAVRGARRLLSRLGALSGVPVMTRELRRACALAEGMDAAAKPSGAGGGDCAVAIVRREDRERLRDAWRAAGLEPLEAEIGVDGIRPEVDGNG